MQIKNLKLKNNLGLHVRTATQLVKTAEQFDCDIWIEREGFEKANGKSIMSVLTLAAPKGTQLTFSADGPQATQALQAIEALVDSGFGEEVS